MRRLADEPELDSGPLLRSSGPPPPLLLPVVECEAVGAAECGELAAGAAVTVTAVEWWTAEADDRDGSGS